MPKFKITGPDGNSYFVTAPEGATEQDALDHLQSTLPVAEYGIDKSQNSLVNDMSPLEAGLVGMGKGMADAAEGVASLFGKSDLLGLGNRTESDNALKSSTAASIGDVLGNIAVTAPTAFIPGANTLRGAAILGGITSGLTHKGDADERLKSAALGAIGGGIGASLPYAKGVAEKVFAPLGGVKSKEKILSNVLNKVGGDDVDSIIARLESAKPLIPGSDPTAAEVALSGGIAGLQRSMSAANPQAYTDRLLMQAAARNNALRGIAKDENALQEAIALRKAESAPFYASADNAVVFSDPVLKDILERLPGGVMSKAKDIARMEGRPFQFGKDLPEEQITFGGLLDAKGKPITTTLPAQYSQISGRGVDLLKKAIDDVLDPNATAAIGKHSSNAAQGVKNDLLNWADSQIPEYAQARQKFAELSKPIDQMKIGQELLNRVEPALARHGALGSENKDMYARALNDVRGNLAKQATGGIKRDLEDVMTPEQMQTLNAIAQDLARKANAENLGRGVGSNSYQNFAMDGIAQSLGVPSSLNGLLQLFAPTRYIANTVNAAGKKAYEGADREMRGLLADALLDPKETARIMKLANKNGLLDKVPLLNKPLAISGLLGAGLVNSAQ